MASLVMTLKFTWVPRAPSAPQTPAGGPQPRGLLKFWAGFQKEPFRDNTEREKNCHMVIWEDKEHKATREYSEMLELNAKIWGRSLLYAVGKKRDQEMPICLGKLQIAPSSHGFPFLASGKRYDYGICGVTGEQHS